MTNTPTICHTVIPRKTGSAPLRLAEVDRSLIDVSAGDQLRAKRKTEIYRFVIGLTVLASVAIYCVAKTKGILA